MIYFLFFTSYSNICAQYKVIGYAENNSSLDLIHFHVTSSFQFHLIRVTKFFRFIFSFKFISFSCHWFHPILFNSSHKIFYTISIHIQSLRNHKFLAQGNKSRCVYVIVLVRNILTFNTRYNFCGKFMPSGIVSILI